MEKRLKGWPRWTALAGAIALAGGCATVHRTPLDAYVAAPDPHYAYEVVNVVEGEGYTAYVVDMTSQAWRSPDEVDRTVWKHWLTIVKPDQVDYSTGLVFIGGGSNRSSAPQGPGSHMAQFAVATNSVVAELGMIPNQPLTFADTPDKARVEDDLIAYAWDKFLRTGDPLWLPRLPMTKAVVRAMDTITALLADEGVGVDSYVVAGGSKRGWTTWTTGAADKRVVAIVPIVIDLLNLEPSFRHHYAVYGFYAPAVRDYEQQGIMHWQGTPEYLELQRIVEPYSYRHRYTMPKFILNSAGDQFFLPDSSQFYYDDLPDEKRLRYVPNTGHGMGGSDAYESLLAFYHAILTDTPRPEYWWRLSPDKHRMEVYSVETPVRAVLWHANNPHARDFRVDTLNELGRAYEPVELEPIETDEHGVLYSVEVDRPEYGWTAYFVELTYDSGLVAPFKFTTEVAVVPDVRPHEDRLAEFLRTARPDR